MKVDREKFSKHFDRFKLKDCSICGKNTWSFVDGIFYMPEFRPDPDGMTDFSYPVIPIVCETCGNTLFISAIVAGLAEKAHTHMIN